MKKKIVLAIMLSVFLAGGTTAYGASNEQLVQINHHGEYHHNSCFSTFFSNAVKRAASCSTNTVNCQGTTTHHMNRVDCVYPQSPNNGVPAGDGTGYQGGGYQGGGYHHSDYGHHGRRHH